MKKWIIVAVFVLFVPIISIAGNYSKQQIKSATSVMKNLKKLAVVNDEGGHLVVEFKEYIFPYDINKRLKFVRAVADSDCVLNGVPRSIFFYNPGNHLVAKADTLNGVRLVDN